MEIDNDNVQGVCKHATVKLPDFHEIRSMQRDLDSRVLCILMAKMRCNNVQVLFALPYHNASRR